MGGRDESVKKYSKSQSCSPGHVSTLEPVYEFELRASVNDLT